MLFNLVCFVMPFAIVYKNVNIFYACQLCLNKMNYALA